MAAEPSKWHVAPGANADCNDIPDTADADSGLASWSALFPQLTALPLSAGGRAPKREDFNVEIVFKMADFTEVKNGD